VFETMIFSNSKVQYLSDHFNRLSCGSLALHMQIPRQLTVSYLEENITRLVAQNKLSTHVRVKLQVWRKPGGTFTPTQVGADFCISVQANVPVASIKDKVLFYEDIPLVYSTISEFKTCSALPYVMAGIARQQTDADDMILLNTDGYISECIASNLFWLKDNQLFTPSLQSACVGGVMRKQVLSKAHSLHIPVREGLFKKADLLGADAVFCCNVAGIQAIRQIEDTVFDIAKLPQALLKI
jgi:branched-chain amino acid aminotransferase/4-amino-4-deoxychorismate lyase